MRTTAHAHYRPGGTTHLRPGQAHVRERQAPQPIVGGHRVQGEAQPGLPHDHHAWRHPVRKGSMHGSHEVRLRFNTASGGKYFHFPSKHAQAHMLHTLASLPALHCLALPTTISQQHPIATHSFMAWFSSSGATTMGQEGRDSVRVEKGRGSAVCSGAWATGAEGDSHTGRYASHLRHSMHGAPQ